MYIHIFSISVDLCICRSIYRALCIYGYIYLCSYSSRYFVPRVKKERRAGPAESGLGRRGERLACPVGLGESGRESMLAAGSAVISCQTETGVSRCKRGKRG
jgi:hypothetical protein